MYTLYKEDKGQERRKDGWRGWGENSRLVHTETKGLGEEEEGWMERRKEGWKGGGGGG